MASTVLSSPIAVEMGIYVVRVFVKLREILQTHKELELRLRELEMTTGQHGEEIRTLFEAVRQLLLPPEKPKRSIGFHVEEPKVKYGVKR